MKIYGANFEGPIFLEILSTLPSWSASDEGRMVYISDVDRIYYGTSTSWFRLGNYYRYLTFYFEGICQDENTIIDGLFFDSTIYIDKITLHARVAPTGANLTVDLVKNNVEASKIATLTDGSTYQRTDITDVSYDTTERFGLKIKSVGSTEAGQGLTVIVHYYE